MMAQCKCVSVQRMYKKKIVVASICASCPLYNAIAYRERVIVKLNLALTKRTLYARMTVRCEC